MIILKVDDIKKQFGPTPLLNGVTFDVNGRQRIGLVGPNGSGKTTLLKILSGDADPDGGRFEFHTSVRVGYLEQQPKFKPGRILWDEAKSALHELIVLGRQAVDIAEAMSKASDETQRKSLSEKYDRLQHELEQRDAYNLDHKIEQVLAGLGFLDESFNTPVQSLSGGEQNRLMLAKLLLAGPDIMLLDEPSNHLDLEATKWLENFLSNTNAAIIVVSHDRYFLDKVTNRTLELFHGTVDSYKGNFSAYCSQKAERLLVQRRTYEKQQIEIAKTEDFIRRNKYGQKHAQAEDRRKKLARIERVDPPREITTPPIAFAEAQRSSHIVFRANRISKSYESQLFENLDFDVTRGQRWGIIGPNGSGKTTILRCIIGEIAPDSGNVKIGQAVQIGYFDQQLASLDEKTEAVDCIRPQHKELDLQQRRDLLAKFGIKGDTALRPIASLSGGERCRVALARLSAIEANVLVLDEPTNHLDLWARNALEDALTAFDGTVLFVSHDRYFINKLANHLLIAQEDQFRVIDGNYECYLLQFAQNETESNETQKAKKPSHQASTTNRGQKTKRRFPYRKVDDLEADIFGRESEIEELHDQLSNSDVLRDGKKAREIKQRLQELQADLTTLYEHWEEANDLNW